MEVIILAGGLGTRLKSVVNNLPKPLAPINGNPFIKYVLEWLYKNNISKVVMSVGYKWEKIFADLGNNYKNIKIKYSIESKPLGTGGAILNSLKLINGDHFLVINGDTLFEINLNQFQLYHKKNNFDVSMGLKHLNNFDRYGKVIVDNKGRIINFLEKEKTKNGIINCGIYLMNKKIINFLPRLDNFSFEKDFLEKNTHNLNFGGFIQNEYFIDIGIPEDFEKAQKELNFNK